MPSQAVKHGRQNQADSSLIIKLGARHKTQIYDKGNTKEAHYNETELKRRTCCCNIKCYLSKNSAPRQQHKNTHIIIISIIVIQHIS